MDQYKLGIVGSRSMKNYQFFSQTVAVIFETLGKPKLIISGGAVGADSYAELYAKENNIELLIIAAEWLKFGKSAGPIRNSKILKECNFLIAFWDYRSPGTGDIIKKAIACKTRVYIININTGKIQVRSCSSN